MNPDEWLKEFLEATGLADTPNWHLVAQMLRLDPEFREAYMGEGSGGLSVDVDLDRLPEAVEALRALPDDAGRERIAAALAPFSAKRR